MAAERIGIDDWQKTLFSHVPLRIVMREWRVNRATSQAEMIDAGTIESSEGETLLPVFTNKKGADDFLIKGGMPEGTIVAFDKASEFKKFLCGLKEDEFAGIVFDPGSESGGKIRIYTLHHAIKIMEYLEGENYE